MASKKNNSTCERANTTSQSGLSVAWGPEKPPIKALLKLIFALRRFLYANKGDHTLLSSRKTRLRQLLLLIMGFATFGS